MSVYIVSGKLGSGKTLASVGKIRDCLARKGRVATNLDIFMEHIATQNDSRAFVIRLPDHPTVDDLNAIGRGQDGIEEKENGLIVLDECGTWLNTRDWHDKGRQTLIDWMLHSRKLGWDVILIVQDLSLIDKQIRTALAEFVVLCKRLDRLRIPVITGIGKLFGLDIRLPKTHLGIVKYGAAPDAPVSERWLYMAKDLYKAYDTRQVYVPNKMIGDVSMPNVGLSCSLSRWHLVGRYKQQNQRITPMLLLKAFVYLVAAAMVKVKMLNWAHVYPEQYIPAPKSRLA